MNTNSQITCLREVICYSMTRRSQRVETGILACVTSRNNPDYLRFYLALVTPNSQADVHFDWDDFSERINNDLIDNIGNFVNRSLSFICRTYGGKVPPGEYDKTDNDAIVEINRISQDVGEFLKKNETDRGLKRVLEFSRYFNQYFQKKQPWKSLGSYMSSKCIRRQLQ